jgi:hypothetical protein
VVQSVDDEIRNLNQRRLRPVGRKRGETILSPPPVVLTQICSSEEGRIALHVVRA